MQSPPIQRALVSVSDKLGLADFARGLVAAGVEIFSTGGTRKHLESEGIAVRDVADYTGFPEMMDGRLKTLHPKVHGGILCRHDNPEDMKALAEHGILTFELVVVNLYPFETTIAQAGRDARRGHRADRHWRADDGPRGGQEPRLHHHRHRRRGSTREILDQIQAHGCTTLELRRKLAGEAFAHTAALRSGDRRLFRRRDGRRPLPRHVAPGLAAASRCCATARTRTSRRPSTATARRRRRQRGRRPATPRQGAFLQQPAGPGQRPGHGPRFRPTRPPWSSSTTTPAAPPWPTRLAEALSRPWPAIRSAPSARCWG